ncbi:hypothetical protein BABINDRAFT_183110, partial [Babjeviella inositovora NRRL Y-12698]
MSTNIHTEKLNGVNITASAVDFDASSSNDPHYTASSPSKWSNFKDSFGRMDTNEPSYAGMTDLERAVAATAKSPLSQSLKSRHLQMIAIGGAIGTGLFVGSGSALRTGGPAALLIGWILVGTMIYCTV